MKEPLVIDYSQKDGSLKIFPSSPLLSISENKDILVEHHQLLQHDVPEHIPVQDAIVVFHEPVSMRWRLGDECKDEEVKAGDIVISPAGISHASSWDQKASFTLLLLKPDLIANVACDLIDPDRVQLLPKFAQSDPVIYEIVRELKSQLESHHAIDDSCIDSTGIFLAQRLLAKYCSREHKLPENTYTLSNHQQKLVIR
jgi:AraC family transcriptional regulator